MTSNADGALTLTILGRLARCLRERASRYRRVDPSRFPAEAAMASAFDALADELEAASREERASEPADLPPEVRLLRAIWTAGCGLGLNCTDDLFVKYGLAEKIGTEDTGLVPTHQYRLTPLGERVLRTDVQPVTPTPAAPP